MNPLSERRRKEIAALTRRRGRDVAGQFLVEGLRSLAAAVDADAPIVDVVVAASVREDDALRLLLDRVHAPVWYAPDRVVQRISDVRTSQGIVAVAAIPQAGSDGGVQGGRVLLLDGVQDPGNVGTLLRSAAWFGVDTVVAGPGTADFHGPKVVRASMGALWDVGLSVTGDLPAEVDRLRNTGFDVWAADLDGVDLPVWHPVPPVALVLGSEAHGLSAAVIARCSGSVCIPDAGSRRGTESLNVAAAGAVLLSRMAGML